MARSQLKWGPTLGDLDCIVEILPEPEQDDSKIEPLIVDGCTKEIPFLDFNSIVIPKEAFFTSENGNARSRGRGRSLTNRALGLDKPCRRPGQRATLDKVGSTIKSAKPKTLGSQFLGSEYLYEEMFPSLDQSSTKKSDVKPSTPAALGCSSTKKTKKEKHLSSRMDEQEENNENGRKSTKFTSESSNVLDNNIYNKMTCTSIENIKEISDESVDRNSSDETKSPSLMTINKNKTEVAGTVLGKFNSKSELDLKRDSDISKEHDIPIKEISDKDSSIINSNFNHAEFEVVQSSSLETMNSEEIKACLTESEKDNKLVSQVSDQLGGKDQNSSLKDVQEASWIESEDHLSQKWDKEDRNSDHSSDQDNHNSNNSSQNTDSSESTNTGDVLSANSTQETLEHCKESLLNSSNSFAQQDTEGNHSLPLPVENTSTVIATGENTSPSLVNLEGPQCKETIDAKEMSEECQDTSTSDMEMEPCNVLLENLPFALTEEELQEIVEPYGEIECYNFVNIKDDSTKTCIIRMPNSLSGELLVVSLDGLEIHGYRIRAKMEDI